MEVTIKRKLHIYIKEGASPEEQREGFDLLLTIHCQPKANGSPPDITPPVMHFAEYFLITDETNLPPAHVLLDFLTTYPHISQVERCKLIPVLAANIVCVPRCICHRLFLTCKPCSQANGFRL